MLLTVEFLQKSHELKLDFSPRDGISVIRYAIKRLAQDSDHVLSKDEAWKESLLNCLGEEALDLDSLAEKKQHSLGGNVMPLGLGDFFFSPEDPLNPDFGSDDDEEEDNDDEL